MRALSKPAEAGSIAQILDYYYENHAREKASAEQAEIYVRHLKRHVGTIKAGDLTKEDQRTYVKDRQSERLKDKKPPLSSETLNRELTVLSAAIRYFYDQKNIQYAPPRVKLLERKAPRSRWLTRSQLAQLFWQLRKAGHPAEHLLILARLGRYSGPRPGQITSLEWSRVDFENRAIWYFDPDDEETNKRAEVVDMSDSIYIMLRRLHNRQRERATRAADRYGEPYREPTHVIQYKGKPVEKAHKGFKRHTRALGWDDVTPNTLRHTFATHAAQHANEVDMTLADLMKAMGHSNIKTTMRYLKHFPGRHKKVIHAARSKKKKK